MSAKDVDTWVMIHTITHIDVGGFRDRRTLRNEIQARADEIVIEEEADQHETIRIARVDQHERVGVNLWGYEVSVVRPSEEPCAMKMKKARALNPRISEFGRRNCGLSEGVLE